MFLLFQNGFSKTVFKLSYSYSYGIKEKPFECLYCSQMFSQKQYLNCHIHIHTKEKPFKCSYCSKTFFENNI